MAQVKAPEAEQPKKKAVDLIPKERLKELLNILLPYGYSHYGNNYTGVSPFIGSTRNVTIQQIAEALGMTVDIVDERLRDLAPLRVLT